MTVTQRSDGLAISWTTIQAATGYSVLRGGVALASVIAPTTSYIDADVFAGSTYCYQVAGVFDDGSETPPSSQVCAVAGGGASPTTIRTITVPIVPSLSTSSLTANLLSVTGSGFGSVHVGIPLSLAVGQIISAVRVRAADSIGLTTGGAVSHFAEALLRQDDTNENFTTIATATPSLGNNTAQTIVISPLSVQVAAGSQYWVALQNASGTGQSLVYRLEIDVQ